MPDYIKTTLSEVFRVTSVVTVHYYEYMSDFSFQGEAHGFWEFLCVDKGEVEVQADDRRYLLKKGRIIFHKPGEFHSLRANGVVAPNLVVVSFDCASPAMAAFENQILTIDDMARNLLSQLIVEAHCSFEGPFDNPAQLQLVRSAKQVFGSEQMIRLYLEQLLIHLARTCKSARPADAMQPVKSLTREKNDTILFNRIAGYMAGNLDKPLTIEDICKQNLIGRSHLQKLFREQKGCGVIDYFLQLRIATAKQMIRESHKNFTEIADSLGYSSIHYFSRQFKKLTGMTPSEYASSIKSLTDAAGFVENPENRQP